MDKQTRLIETSIRLFHEKGFHGTPTSLIAKEAGVANGTLFQYFRSKENLILQAYNSIKEEMGRYVETTQTGAGTIMGHMKSVLSSSITWALDHPLKFDFIQQFHTSPYLQKVEQETIEKHKRPHMDMIQEAIDQKVFKPLPKELIYTLISSHTFGMYQYLRANEVVSHERNEVIETGLDLLIKMIS